MDKKLFFVIGSIIVVIILAVVWGYLLFFGTPGTVPGTFSTIDLGDTTDQTITDLPATDIDTGETPIIDITSEEKLRQLTTKPVAGFQAVQVSSTSPRLIYYVEAGTGHLYTINLESGEEVRRSGTTIVMATDAKISSDGMSLVVRSGQGERAPVQLGRYNESTDTYDFIELPGEWLDYQFTTTGELMLAEKTQSGVSVTTRNLATGSSRPIFTVPFREAVIVWGNTSSDTHYVYPKPSRLLEGFVYAVRQGELERLPIEGEGLTALGDNNGVVYSTRTNNQYSSYYLNTTTKEVTSFPLVALPEKCAAGATSNQIIYCATSFGTPTDQLPDSWYQGILSVSDHIWEIVTISGSSQLLVAPNIEVGRALDIQHLVLDSTYSVLYFTNKNDNTLWLYEI